MEVGLDWRDLPEEIAEAHRYIEKEYKKRNIVTAVAHAAKSDEAVIQDSATSVRKDKGVRR
jgi:hypothetical protein